MRSAELLTNVTLAASTTLRGLRDDPLEMILQMSRRLPRSVPDKLGRALAVGAPGPVRSAYAEWIADRPEQARKILAETPPRSRRRLFAELATQLNVANLVPDVRLRGPLRRRVAQRGGDVLEPSPGFSTAQPTRAHAKRKPEEPLAVFHLLTNSVPHTSSGYAYRSHAVLKAQREAGLRVAAATRLGYPVIVGKVGAMKRDVVDGVEYFRLLRPLLGRSIAERTRQAADLLEPIVRSFGADVLSTTSDYTNALVAQDVAGRLRIPWTYEVRGLPEDTWAASKPSPAERERARRSKRYRELQHREVAAAQAADHVFTLGAALRDDFVDRGVPAEMITIVRNAADIKKGLMPSPAEQRARLGLPRDGFWVGTVSSLVEYEGIDTALEAVALARSRGADIRALVVGDGAARAGLIERARVLGLTLGTDVVFRGRVPRSAAADYFAALDVFVVPRRDERVCRLVPPLKPFEAIAAGRPIAVSDLPALRDLASSSEGGVVVTRGDASAWSAAIMNFSSGAEGIRSAHALAHTHPALSSWSGEGQGYREALSMIVDRGTCDV